MLCSTWRFYNLPLQGLKYRGVEVTEPRQIICQKAIYPNPPLYVYMMTFRSRFWLGGRGRALRDGVQKNKQTKLQTSPQWSEPPSPRTAKIVFLRTFEKQLGVFFIIFRYAYHKIQNVLKRVFFYERKSFGYKVKY